jgi:O-antigen/teichoic acid export membrane protein
MFYTSITLTVIILGMDYYTYNSREVINAGISRSLHLIRDQFYFHIISYSLLILIVPLLLEYGYIHNYIFHFVLILIFEHLSQEVFRLLTVLSFPIFANFILFIRMAFWCGIILLVYSLGIKEALELNYIYSAWIIAAGISFIFGIIKINEIKFKEVKWTSINLKNIKKGLSVSLLYFISTISFKLVEFSSRYFIDYDLGKAEAGIFVFFSNISNLIHVIVFSSTIMIFSPKLIQAYSEKDSAKTRSIFRDFLKELLTFTLLSSIIIGILIHPILTFLNKEPLIDQINTFYILLASNVIFNLSFYPHYLLYVRNRDKMILISAIISACITLLLNFFLIPMYGIIGGAYSILMGFIVLIIMKYIFYKKTL